MSDKATISRVHQARQSVTTTFKTKYEEMQENSDFYRLLQYSTEQLRKFSKDKRVPYTIDYITDAIDTLFGAFRLNPTDIYYFPVSAKDELRVEVLNAVAGSVLRVNGFKWLEGHVLLDGLIEKTGAVGFEWSREKNKNGALSVFRIPPRQLMWDVNGLEYDKSKSMWMSRHRLYSKRDLINRYPDLEKEINKLGFTVEVLEDLGLSSKDYVNQILDDKLGVVALIEFYERNYSNRWFIQTKTDDGVDFSQTYFDTRKDAEKSIREFFQRYEQELVPQFASLRIMPPAPPTKDVFLDRVPVIQKTEVAHNLLVSDTEDTDLPDFPYSTFHPYFHDGDWWSKIDTMKDPQRYMNKMFSMLDHWISSMSKGLLLIDDKIPEAEAKKVTDMFSKTGGSMRVSDIQAYSLIESKGPAPQLFSMMEVARQNLEDKSGGRNFQGKKETASESGRAVSLRIQQGSLSSQVIFENLSSWKQNVGEKVAWYLTNYMKASEIFRLEGPELVEATKQALSQGDTGMVDWFKTSKIHAGVGFLEVNTTEQNTIEGLRVDTVVDEARHSSTKNERTLEMLSLALQSNPTLAETFPPETMIKLMPLPFTEKQKAIEMSHQLLQAKLQREQAMAQKPPTLTASLSDIKDLPPEGQIQLAAMFGIKLDPQQMGGMDLKDLQKMMLEKAKSDQKMAMEQEKHQSDIETKQALAVNKMGIDQAMASHKMSIAQQGNGEKK